MLGPRADATVDDLVSFGAEAAGLLLGGGGDQPTVGGDDPPPARGIGVLTEVRADRSGGTGSAGFVGHPRVAHHVAGPKVAQHLVDGPLERSRLVAHRPNLPDLGSPCPPNGRMEP